MRTFVYVDGFNLYYGALKGTAFRWLDLVSVFEKVLQPHHEILRVKYFTARVSGTLTDPWTPQRQDVYLRALRHFRPEVDVYFGHFLSHTVRAPLAQPMGGRLPDPAERLGSLKSTRISRGIFARMHFNARSCLTGFQEATFGNLHCGSSKRKVLGAHRRPPWTSADPQARAFANFFAGRAKYLRFRKRRTAQSIRFQLDRRTRCPAGDAYWLESLQRHRQPRFVHPARAGSTRKRGPQRLQALGGGTLHES